MSIKTISLESFLVHKDRSFDLSPGVNLITGANGSGKTTVLQGLIWGLWGQKVRGFEEASVRLETSRGSIWRRAKSCGELVDLLDGQERIKSSNKTRMLPLIESRFGSFEAWKRSLWITGKNVGSFSGATPKGRWDHLMRVVGAEVFDKALDKSQARRKPAADSLKKSRYQVQQVLRLRQNCADAIRELQESTEILPGGMDTSVLRAKIEAQVARMDALDVAQKAALRALKEAEASGHLSRAEEALERAINARKALPESSCFVCGQPVPSPEREALERMEKEARATRDQARTDLALLSSSYREYSSSYSQERSVLETLQSRMETAGLSERLFLNHEKQVLDLLDEYYGYWSEEDRLYQDLLGKTRQGLIVESAHEVLLQSKKRYIASFCKEIEKTTNRFLRTIGAKHQVSLVFSSGSLEIHTSGTGAEDYESCSSGEQRRIDICLLLAMSQVAASAGNLTESTPLVVDEALDTLDEAGVEALLWLACDIAKRRQVVLVSHVLPPLPVGTSIRPITL
ncbi:MAG: hypothetical protein E6Q97_35195 [Desulfurellales bacterium]|nr:MAG: hypothetical protein E6Q97_35195 [Desulfurellales bacterium]